MNHHLFQQAKMIPDLRSLKGRAWLGKGLRVTLLVFIVGALVGRAIGMGGVSSLVLIFQGLVGFLALFFLWRRPYYIPIAFIAVSCTLPAIDAAQMVKIGSIDFRAEYIMVLLGIVLLIERQNIRKMHTPLDSPVLAFFIIQFLSVFVAFAWGREVALGGGRQLGIGGIIRLVSSYAFFFMASRLTDRERIPRLALWLTVIATLVTSAIILTNLSGSTWLYAHLFVFDPSKVEESRFYSLFFKGMMTPWIWLAGFDGFVLIPLVVSTVVVLLRRRGRVWYGLVAMLIVLRAFAGAQRFVVVFALAGLVVPLFVLTRSGNGSTGRRFFNWVVLASVVFVALLVLVEYLPAWAEKLRWLGIRLSGSFEELQGYRQVQGIHMAWSQLIAQPIAFVTGFGYFLPYAYDINLGPLLTVYYYGIPGLVVLLWMLLKAFRQSWRLLQVASLRPVEYGLVCAVLVSIPLFFFFSFVRGLSFIESAQVSAPFAILLGWVQVIWLDVKHKQADGVGVTGCKYE